MRQIQKMTPEQKIQHVELIYHTCIAYIKSMASGPTHATTSPSGANFKFVPHPVLAPRIARELDHKHKLVIPLARTTCGPLQTARLGSV